MNALVTGATGLVGRSLVGALGQATILSRNPTRAQQSLGATKAFAWEPQEGPPPAEAFSGIDVVFHLAGEPVAAGRWTLRKKNAIRQSRVVGTRNLITTLASLKQRPTVLVSASAVGYYGDRGDQELTEASEPAATFLAEVCLAWEAEAQKARELNLRVVPARIGIVLAPNGGALSRMLVPFRMGLGGRLGHGRQWMPWVHIDDVVGLLTHAAHTQTIKGPMNVVGPKPVTNKVFTHTLARTLGRPAVLPVPRLGLRAALGEMSQILFASQRALPQVAEDTGYRFRYCELGPAIAACLNKNPPTQTQ